MRARCAAGDFDFVDGIVHAPDHLVLCLGRFEEEAPRISSYRGTEIYYKSTAELTEDHVSTFDYCFRYDTECHWLSGGAPPLEWRPVRRLVGRWFLGSENLIRWSERLGPLPSSIGWTSASARERRARVARRLRLPRRPSPARSRF